VCVYSRLQIRDNDDLGAMGDEKRAKRRLRSAFRKVACYFIRDEQSNAHDDEDSENPRRKQYRIEAGQPNTCSRCLKSSYEKNKNEIGMVIPRSHSSISSCLHWMFRVNFCVLFALSCSAFFVFTASFACLIFFAGSLSPKCVRVSGEEFQPNASGFADAFALSWTTFSTVGYGNTYPALGDQNDTKDNCMAITVICSTECFFGILYSGFCGAILFAKVLRLQSRANVLFSDTIVVRYGLGVHSQVNYKTSIQGKKLIPCPVLEFRVLNKLFDEVGGEIIDATLNVVARIDANEEDPNNVSQSDATSWYDSMHHIDHDSRESVSLEGRKQRLTTRLAQRMFLTSSLRSSQNTNSSVTSVKKRIFTKLNLEINDHPFFKRVWIARHILDENSPILTQSLRQKIQRYGGIWPEYMNNYESIKKALNFGQIIVSFNGVSNLSASDVYAQKIYDRVDVNVGYEFVKLLYRDGDTLKIDIDLINDVREQYGGGGEPLTLFSHTN
jgi:Ion channel